MKSDEEDSRHFLKSATSIADASCSGSYMGVTIEKVLINVPVSAHTLDETKEKDFTLIRVLFTNIWAYRIDLEKRGPKLIDTEGIQHSEEMDSYIYRQGTQVRLSGKQYVPYDFEYPAGTLEGKAKTRGWLWFPALPKGIYPYRLIFLFRIFAPGDTSGSIEHEETLEIIFDFKFKQLLPDAKSFVTLEIEGQSETQS
jgi:hypothetical protein